MKGESGSIGSCSLRISRRSRRRACAGGAPRRGPPLEEISTTRRVRSGQYSAKVCATMLPMRVADDVGALDVERIEQQLDVVGEIQARIAALGLARAAVAAQVDEDQAQAADRYGTSGTQSRALSV